MNRLTCCKCDQPIPNGKAHIRSRNFRQVALCDDCVSVHQGPHPIPQQRSGTHDDLTPTTTVSTRFRG